MTLKSLSISTVVATMLAVTPAMAQQREHRGEQGRRPQAETRQENRSGGERAQPRAEAPRTQSAPAPRVEPRAEPRRETPPAPQVRTAPVQPMTSGPVAPRADQRAVPRSQPRYNNNYGRDYGHDYGHDYGRSYGYNYSPWHYTYRPWYGYRGYSPFRPYYFRPSYRIGFGIYVGYPVDYYAYPYPVPVYGYGAPYSEVYVGPNTQYGGVALNIRPDDGYVYVDGSYVGIVRDFDGSRQPLTLTPGLHHIQIDQNGFEPLAFDVTVQPGQVIPYQGDLRPY